MRAPRPIFLLGLLLTVCFTFSVLLEPAFQKKEASRPKGVLGMLLGDGRRIFANHFFVKADEYFHSGFYPTFFDNRESFQTAHMAEDAGAVKGNNTGDEAGFMGEPRDFIERFSRHFEPSKHTHLDEGGAEGTNELNTLGDSGAGEVREILPWLRISADLDPNRIETYTTTAYWLRKRMGRVDEAEQFIREGLRANPYHPALLYELGRIYSEDRKDDTKARNIWELAVTKFDQQKLPKNDQNDFILLQLTLSLARLEEAQGKYAAAVGWLEREKTVSPNPAEIEKQIAEDRQKLLSGASPTNTPPPGASTP